MWLNRVVLITFLLLPRILWLVSNLVHIAMKYMAPIPQNNNMEFLRNMKSITCSKQCGLHFPSISQEYPIILPFIFPFSADLPNSCLPSNLIKRSSTWNITFLLSPQKLSPNYWSTFLLIPKYQWPPSYDFAHYLLQVPSVTSAVPVSIVGSNYNEWTIILFQVKTVERKQKVWTGCFGWCGWFSRSAKILEFIQWML